MATFVRDHGLATAATSGASIALTLGYDVPVGRVLLVVVANQNLSDPTGLSKPLGESATWVKVGSGVFDKGDGNARGSTSVWAIKTTTTWFASQVVTASWASANPHRSIAMSEWVGLKAERLGALSSDDTSGNRNPPYLNVATTTDVNPGDLLLIAGAMYTGDFQPTLDISSQGGTATLESSPSWVGAARPGTYPAYWYFAPWRAAVVTGTGTRTATLMTQKGGPITGYPAVALMLAIPADDYPPYTPTITSMTGGVVLNRNRTNRLTWTFSSPNAVDNQSKYDVRYRPAGDTTWTTVTATTTNSFRDFPASTFAAGDWEIQVRVYGALGKDSPWSPSAYFTMADPPAGAVITYPIDGQTVDQLEHIDWSIPAQDAYQFRRLGDDPDTPGTPDPGDVIYDSGEVTDTTTRTLPVTFAINGRDEHLQVRVKDAGLWQDEWDSVRVTVSYTPPPTPTRVLYTDPDTASLLVEITNPEPTGDDPAAVNNEIWIDDGNGWERRAVGLPLNAVWRYWLPVSGRDYSTSIRVVAVAANGTTASST